MADNLVPQHVSLLEYGADDVDFKVFILDVGNRIVNLGVKFVAHIAHGGDAQFFQGIEELGLYHFHALHQILHRTFLLCQRTLQIICHREHPLDGVRGAVAIDSGFFPLSALAEVIIFRTGTQVLVFKRRQLLTEEGALVQAVLTAWGEGPQEEGLLSCLPESGQVRSATVQDGICTVDLSAEFVSGLSPDRTQTRLAVYALVNTLGGLETVDGVRLLVEGQAICMGYANTFQLFMDLLDIPCVTVIGASGGSREDHAWNLVQLDGDWYAVDTTWDDPLGSYVGVPAANEKEHHRYFNVTSDFLRQTDHQWDYDAVQEATGTRWTWSVLRTSHRT